MKQLNIAVQQHFLSHYREVIFNYLCRQEKPRPQYTLYADITNKEQIKTISFKKSFFSPEEGGLRWIRIKNFQFGRIFLFQPFAIIIGLISKYDCIIFLGNMYHLSTWISAIFARLTGKRVLMWTHGYLTEEHNLKGWFRERFYRLADGLLLYGNRARDILISRGFKSENLYIVYNSLDYDRQISIFNSVDEKELFLIKKSLFKSPQFPMLIFTGRLNHQKNIHLLIEAIYILRSWGQGVNVLLVGDGPARDDLISKVKGFGLEDVVNFYGTTYREEELGPLIMAAVLCVSPGEVGLTCIHALTYGTPVITHDDPDFQPPEWEAIEAGVTGGFFKRNSAIDLARVVQDWLTRDNPQEQTRRRCQEIIAKYYNARYQTRIINSAVEGIPATEL